MRTKCAVKNCGQTVLPLFEKNAKNYKQNKLAFLNPPISKQIFVEPPVCLLASTLEYELVISPIRMSEIS